MHSWGRPRARRPTDYCAASEQLRSWLHGWVLGGLRRLWRRRPVRQFVSKLDQLALVFSYKCFAAEIPADLTARLALRGVRLAVMPDLQVRLSDFLLPTQLQHPLLSTPLHINPPFSLLLPPLFLIEWLVPACLSVS